MVDIALMLVSRSKTILPTSEKWYTAEDVKKLERRLQSDEKKLSRHPPPPRSA